MADDFYNQNIGPLKGSYFGPGVGSFESRQRSSDYLSKSINPVRESIKETEERKMQAERARQLIEAEKERRIKAAKEAELELAAQKKVEGVFGKVESILQIEDLVERQAALNQLESSLSIADRQDPKIKAALGIPQTEIDEAEEETQAQREKEDSTLEASANLLISRGKLKQARAKAREITDPAKRDEILSAIPGKKSSTAAGLKRDFTDMTKTATTALSALSKITPSSVAQEPKDEGANTEDTPGVTVTEAPQGEPTQGGDTSDEKPLYGGEEDSGNSTSRTNRQILQAARDSYESLFGAEEANKLFDKYDAENISSSERRELSDKAKKDLAGIKRKSRTNKKFFKQFVPGEGILPLPEKPKPEDPESDTEKTKPFSFE